MIDPSTVFAFTSTIGKLIYDIVQAAAAGTSADDLVNHARRAVRDYHTARPEGRAAMRAAWGDLGDSLWGPRRYVGDSVAPVSDAAVGRTLPVARDAATDRYGVSYTAPSDPADTLPGGPDPELPSLDLYPDDLPPGEQGPGTVLP